MRWATRSGRQARGSNAKFFLGADDAQVVSVCDVDRWRLDEAKKQIESAYAKKAKSGKFAGCSTHVDFREVIADPNVDAVLSVLTPQAMTEPVEVAQQVAATAKKFE